MLFLGTSLLCTQPQMDPSPMGELSHIWVSVTAVAYPHSVAVQSSLAEHCCDSGECSSHTLRHVLAANAASLPPEPQLSPPPLFGNGKSPQAALLLWSLPIHVEMWQMHRSTIAVC